MRKFPAVLFALLLLGAIAGCSSDDTDDPDAGEQSSQAESTAGEGSEGSDTSADGPDDAAGDANDDSADGPDDPNDSDDSQDVPAGGPVSVPSDLVDDILEVAAAEDQPVTDEEASCIGEMMVIVLGEDGARDAVAGGIDAIDAAMGAATDDFSDESYREMMTEVSEECQALMTLDTSVGPEG